MMNKSGQGGIADTLTYVCVAICGALWGYKNDRCAIRLIISE